MNRLSSRVHAQENAIGKSYADIVASLPGGGTKLRQSWSGLSVEKSEAWTISAGFHGKMLGSLIFISQRFAKLLKVINFLLTK
jgi:hypothetical protein